MPRCGGDMPRCGSWHAELRILACRGVDPGMPSCGPFHVIERIFLFKNLYLTHSKTPCGSVLGRFCVLLNHPLLRAK